MTQVAGSGGGGGSGRPSNRKGVPYTKHGPGTKWVYYKSFPPGIKRGDGATKGWLQVGSNTYNAIRQYNSTPHTRRTSNYQPAKPTKQVVSRWNPESPEFKRAVIRGANPAVHGGRKLADRPPAEQVGERNQRQRTQQRMAGGGGGGHGGNGGGKTQRQNYGTLGRQIGSTKVGQMLDPGMADQLAGYQFDPQIHDLKDLLAKLPIQTQQNQADISQWYNQVDQLNQQAGSRAQASAQQMAGADDNTTQALLAALGGGASGAGGMVAAQGDANSAMSRMLGATAQQYSNDISPMLALAAASAKQAQQVNSGNQQHDYESQLADLMGQRGQAKAQQLLSILGSNNQLAQQRFANRLSKLQAQSGIVSLLGDQRLQNAQIGQINAQTRAAGGGTGRQTFVSLDPFKRAQIIDHAVGAATASNGKVITGHTRSQAMNYLKGLGFDPQSQAIQAALRTYY